MPLLDPPADAQLEAEDYWLFLHLIIEHMAHYYRFCSGSVKLGGAPAETGQGHSQPAHRAQAPLASLLAPSCGAIGQRYPGAGSSPVEQVTMTCCSPGTIQQFSIVKEVRVVIYQIMMLVAPICCYRHDRRPSGWHRYLGGCGCWMFNTVSQTPRTAGVNLNSSLYGS